MDNEKAIGSCVNTSLVTNDSVNGVSGHTSADKYFYSIQITEADNGENGFDKQCAECGECVECGAQCAHSVGSAESGGQSLLRCMQSCGDNFDYSVLDVMSSDRSQRSYKPSFNSRQMHNQKERMRRSRMKSSCEALRRMVPGVNDKTDKATVLEQTVNFLLHLSTCSGVNCTDYMPETAAALSSKSIQCYQQYVPSKAMIKYHSSLNLAQSRPLTELEHHFKQMEVQMCQNDANHSLISGDMSGNTSGDTIGEISGESGDHQMMDQTGASNARLVTTNDGRQFMVIDTIDTIDTINTTAHTS